MNLASHVLGIFSLTVDKHEDLTLLKRPFLTVYYFIRELIHLVKRAYLWALQYRTQNLLFLSTLILAWVIYKVDSPFQPTIATIESKILWCCYWLGLGILSSVGLGCGLHTFLLYLGPHIAAVTLAAYECGSLNFPKPPYPDEILCPDEEPKPETISILTIMWKVKVEAFMWGAGTALGELPPYFMARAATLSGEKDDYSEDETEEEEIKEMEITDCNGQKVRKMQKSVKRNMRRAIKEVVEKWGFLGILICASIPNPLFDLAGITCGHFLVPFWTFFGATLIGKAVNKMLLQVTFVVVAFNEHNVEKMVSLIKRIPAIGKYIHEPFREFLVKQKASLHRDARSAPPGKASWLAFIFEKIVAMMVIYFIGSIINSLAQNHLKRLQKECETLKTRPIMNGTSSKKSSKDKEKDVAQSNSNSNSNSNSHSNSKTTRKRKPPKASH